MESTNQQTDRKMKDEQVKAEENIQGVATKSPRPAHRRPWLSMDTAPRNATTIEVRLKSGKTLEAHWAQDMSGEDQPPFKGWFKRSGPKSCVEIETPVAWRPVTSE